MAIEIVSFPIENGGSSLVMLVYQRVFNIWFIGSCNFWGLSRVKPPQIETERTSHTMLGKQQKCAWVNPTFFAHDIIIFCWLNMLNMLNWSLTFRHRPDFELETLAGDLGDWTKHVSHWTKH
jgi:hypothetical protein